MLKNKKNNRQDFIMVLTVKSALFDTGISAGTTVKFLFSGTSMWNCLTWQILGFWLQRCASSGVRKTYFSLWATHKRNLKPNFPDSLKKI